MKTLALLHTTAVTVPLFRELAAAHMPGTRVVNLLDDSLLEDVIAAGRVPDAVERRLRAYVEQAAVLGASAVMSCCSSVGEAMERAGAGAPLPVWRIDEAMAEEAVRAERVGVLATLPTTLAPTAALVERKAREAGTRPRVEAMLVEGAFAALKAGRPAEHDAAIAAALQTLVARADLVVLAQASMARLLSALPAPPSVPILTSPVSGLRHAAARLEALP